jgi:excisionase family DNA binding protein
MPLIKGLNKGETDKMESLDSIVFRLSRDNHYGRVRWITHLICEPHIQWGELDLLYWNEHFESLAELARTDIDTIYAHTLHSLLHGYYSPEKLASMVGVADYGELPRPLWTKQGVLKYTRYRRTLCGQAVCPHCWAESKSTLLPWSLLHVTTCPRHGVLLVDRCAECGSLWRKASENGRCSTCYAYVGHFRARSIREHGPSSMLQSLIFKAFGYDVAQEVLNIKCAQPESPIYELSPHNLMRFLYRFGQILMLRDPENPIFGEQVLLPGNAPLAPYASQNPWDVSSVLGVADLHNVFTGVCQLLLDWPRSWYMTLERLVERDGRRLGQRLPQILRREFGGSEWAWLTDSWEEFVRQNARSSIALQPWLHYYRDLKLARGEIEDVLSPRQAARQLGVRVERFKSMIEDGAIEATPRIGGSQSRSGKRRYVTLLTTETVKHLKLVRQNELTLTEIAGRLGIGESTTRDLIAAGMLERDGLFNRNKPGVLENTLDSFLEGILAKAEVLPLERNGEALLTLEQASRIGTYYGPTIFKLLRAVQYELIRVLKVEGERGLGALRFYEADVWGYALNERQPDGRVLVARSEVRAVLHCTYETLNRYCKLGLLVPTERSTRGPKGVRRYDSLDVEAFQRRYVKSSEAAALLGCTMSTLRELVQLSHIPSNCIAYIPASPGGHYLFVREALAEWGQDRISTREAAGLLGVAVLTVRAWTAEGRFIRIGPLWLSRRQVMEWVQDRITTKEAAALLGISVPSVQKWVRAGKIAPVDQGSANGKLWYFSRKALTEWQQARQEDRTSVQETAELLGVTVTTLFKWMRLGNITPVERRGANGQFCYFSKSEITQWRAARMTVKEAREALGINLYKWDYWRELGRVVPMNDGFVGQAWFSRDAVMKLIVDQEATPHDSEPKLAEAQPQDMQPIQ